MTAGKDGVLASQNCKGELAVMNHNTMFAFKKQGGVQVTYHFTFQCWDSLGNNMIGAEIGLYGNCDQGQDQPRQSQDFVYNETSKQIMHPPSSRCAEIFATEGKILLQACKDSFLEQQWTIIRPRWLS